MSLSDGLMIVLVEDQNYLQVVEELSYGKQLVKIFFSGNKYNAEEQIVFPLPKPGRHVSYIPVDFQALIRDQGTEFAFQLPLDAVHDRRIVEYFH